ncbi:hypothetical protein OCS65_13005 [Rhodococcus aetherivorans]|uniref:Uncharacterized protein n=1 Tax=Rhodococcus aetherivorans TaxID=191292 RepID=A0AA46P1G3_9NOCA|nr:hypothetical protein [Rhodococcus aetherivorans]UYF96601.1 hypothetical protein OCS65_13005 [Rhodococcus aetherivorans]
MRDYREFLEHVLHDHGTTPHRTCRSARGAGHIEAIVNTAAPSRAAVLERFLDERLRQRTCALEQVAADTGHESVRQWTTVFRVDGDLT